MQYVAGPIEIEWKDVIIAFEIKGFVALSVEFFIVLLLFNICQLHGMTF